MSERRLSFWGWGYADKFPDLSARRSLARRLRMLLRFRTGKPHEPPRLADVELPLRAARDTESTSSRRSSRRVSRLTTPLKDGPTSFLNATGDREHSPPPSAE